MIRFMESTKNAVFAKNKPIEKRYEAMLLATPGNAHGYVLTFSLRNTGSAIDVEASNFSITDAPFPECYKLIPTNRFMLYLISRVPTSYESTQMKRHLVIYADNRFWNISVIIYLRKISIVGCGKFRRNAKCLLANIKKTMAEYKSN